MAARPGCGPAVLSNMADIYISAFTADFRHYDDLTDWIDSFQALTVGAELAVAWNSPDFYELLEPMIPLYRERPVTLHGPFIEMCTEPGSEAETELKSLIAEHQKETGSEKASAMLADWEQYRAKFVRIFPVEYRNALKAKGNI